MAKWLVSIKVLKPNGEVLFKVTRRMPELKIAETKFFKNKEEALKQFNEWLQ
ncbi:MAG TPA: hypothetical protein VJB94_00370 [Candidatus Nanoarchaeia archaeon]|nr:hypothetical protein [Candidatus Nanoarchaeia archaeon]